MANERLCIGFRDSQGNEIHDGDYIGKNGEPFYKMFIARGSQQPMMENLNMRKWTENVFKAPNPVSPICDTGKFPHLSYAKLHDMMQDWIIDCKFVIVQPEQQ